MDQPVQFQDQDSVIIEDDEITKADSDSDSNTEVAISNYWRFGNFPRNDQLMVQRVEKGSSDYENVKKSFVFGMRNFGKHIDVVGIHKKNYEYSVMDEARVEAFRVFAAAVASRNGGDPNIKYGWYGGSREEIREILCYGFRRFENRSSSYGHGVYLSPANNPMESAHTSITDPDGLRHILLCRVILGRPEPISFGSRKDQPTSMEFDSGVDDISSPTKYVIWEPYMNSHVLPVFVISFQSDSLTGTGSLRIPMSQRMSTNEVMKHLTNYLSSSKMALINRHHQAFYENKISRHAFIRNLRIIAGDDILRAILQGLLR